VHPQLRAAADRQMGVFTMADAQRAGYTHTEVQRLCATGEWVRLRRGAYTTPAISVGSRHRSDCVAVLLTLGRPSAAVSHGSAARLLGLPVTTGDDVVRLTDPTRSRTGSGFSMVRSPLATEELLVRGPLRLTAPARTLADCARDWPLEAAVVALDGGLLAGCVSKAEVRRVLGTQHRWPGAPAARRAVDLADGRAESPLETRGRLRLLGAGRGPDALQVEVRSGSRLVAVVDAWYEEAAVAVEFDGRVKYTAPWRDPGRVLWEEKRREDELRSLDIRVVRIADEDLGPSWGAVERHLVTVLSRPGPARRRFTAVARERGRVLSA
jgi:hypothetical protein